MPVDDGYYDRADAHIKLSNQQISDEVGVGKVSSSMMHATARFNAWVSARGFESGIQMSASKYELIEYFVNDFRDHLEENLDDYIDNFDDYMGVSKESD